MNWIIVEDKKPIIGEQVLLCFGTNGYYRMVIGSYVGKEMHKFTSLENGEFVEHEVEKEFWRDGHAITDVKPKAWMPLPFPSAEWFNKNEKKDT